MSFMDEIRKIPPVTRFLCASTLAVSVPVMVGVVSPYSILFARERVVREFEIWRVFTSFFFGGSGISFLFELIMLYRNSDGLESTQYAGRSADYAWQLLLAAIAILGLNIPLNSYIHFRPLLLSTVYVSSRLAPSAPVSLFGLLTLQNAHFPYALLAMDLVVGGPRAAAGSVTGLIAGHAWWWLVHSAEAGRAARGYAAAPPWMRALVGGGGGGGAGAGGGVGGRVADGARAAGGAAARTVQQATGHRWGSGQRLGDQ